ncbi:MAG: carboxypeptidase regulatory-like domain-containing protein [Myxococcales bacterium]|nr:carboxypeptidase regulatory-like domain-containing protein [Myxococcales bacterium]
MIWRWSLALLLGLVVACSGPTPPVRVVIAGPVPPGMPHPQDHDAAQGLLGIVVDGAGEPVIAAEVTFTSIDGDRALVVASDDEGMLRGVLEAGRYRVDVRGPGLLAATIAEVAWPADALRIIASRAVGLAGVVLDGTTPVRGAQVRAVRDGIEEFAVVADADGHFAFAGLTQGSYRIYAYAGDLVARSRLVEHRGGAALQALTLSVEPAFILVGSVRDAQTQVGLAAHVLITAVGHDEPARLAVANSEGQFRFEGVPHGRWQISAAATAYLASTPQEVVQAAAMRAPVALTLRRGETLEVRVLDRAQRPVAGATVWVQRAGEGGAGSIAAISRTSGAGLQLQSRAELGVTSGPVPLIPRVPAASAAAPLGAVARPSHVYVAQAMNDGADGPALDMTHQRLVLPDARGVQGEVTDAGGEVRLVGLAPVAWEIVATHADYVDSVPHAMTLTDAGAAAPLRLTLHQGGSVGGRVTDASLAPVAGAVVRWHRGGSEQGASDAFAVTNARGEFSLTRLLGRGTLLASSPTAGDAEVALELGEGDHKQQTIILHRLLGQLRGEVVDEAGAPVAGAQLALGATGRTAITGAGGAFELMAIDPGDHELRVTHRDFLPLELKVRGDAGLPQRLVLRAGSTLVATILDRHTGVPVPGATATLSMRDLTMRASADDAGVLRFRAAAAGHWRLAVDVPGYVSIRREIVLDAALHELRIEFERGALVSGVVRDRFGGRLSQARVRVTRPADGVVAEAITTSEGAFVVRGAPSGEVVVTAELGGQQTSEKRTLRPADELTSLELTVR